MNDSQLIIIGLLAIISLLFIKNLINILIFIVITVGLNSFFLNIIKLQLSGSIPIAIAGSFCTYNILKALKSMFTTSLKSNKGFKDGLNGKITVLAFELSLILTIIMTYILFSLYYIQKPTLKSTLIFALFIYVLSFLHKIGRKLLIKYSSVSQAVVYIDGNKVQNTIIQEELSSNLDELKDLAYKDKLTGVNNRTSYEEKLNSLNSDNQTYRDLAVFVFDINNLKKMNDNYGHIAGDTYIKECIDTILKVLDKNKLFRIGGDEFVYILDKTSTKEIEKINKDLDVVFSLVNKDRDFPLSIAYGYYLADSENNTFAQIFEKADSIMYENKILLKKQSK